MIEYTEKIDEEETSVSVKIYLKESSVESAIKGIINYLDPKQDVCPLVLAKEKIGGLRIYIRGCNLKQAPTEAVDKHRYCPYCGCKSMLNDSLIAYELTDGWVIANKYGVK